MKLIDKRALIEAIDRGDVSTSEDIEGFREIDAIPIKWLHKQLIEQMYERKLPEETMKVFHEIIARYDNEIDSGIR